jgi:hypothetical protein
MMQPGATGYGLHLGTVADPECDCGGYSFKYYRAHWVDGQLWQQPSIIKWSSPINPATYAVYDEISKEYIDQQSNGANPEILPILGPHIAVTDFRFIHNESRWAFDHNMVMPEERWMLEDPIQTTIGDVYGFLPVWEIMPISEELLEALMLETAEIHTEQEAWILDYCYCSIDSDMGMLKDENGKFVEYIIGHEKDCEYKMWQEACSCGQAPTIPQVYQAFWDQRPSLIEGYTAPFDKAIETLEKSKLRGWQRAHDIETTLASQGEHCYSWYLQAHSPYSPSLGPRAQTKEQLLSFINSETQQAS